MYTVYVLYSRDHDKLYIGYTSNLSKRMISHNETGNGYTKRYSPWVVIYTEEYAKRSEAMKREKALKGGQGRSWIRANLLKKE
jgi:putative endonuclease